MEETIALIQQAHEGRKDARDRLVEENMGLVWSIVRRFANRGYEPEDLFQIGSIGLIKAIDKFDLTMEVRFSTYAVPLITGEIKRFLRDDGMIKISRAVKENSWKIKRAADKLSQQYGREATVEELAREVQLETEEIVMAMEAGMEVESIYRPVYQGDGKQIDLVDKLPEKRSETETCLNKIVTRQLLDSLEQTERELIVLRYFEEKTQNEIAATLGMSQVQVSRMEKKILRKLRSRL